MGIRIRQAGSSDVQSVSGILTEAAEWLERCGMAMWPVSRLTVERTLRDIDSGIVFLAEHYGRPVGTLTFQLADPKWWPDALDGESAFVHRLAVRRDFAGGEVSSALLSWAVQRTKSIDRRFLRLDCEAARSRLKAVYERFGFRHHSDFQVGPHLRSRYQIVVSGFDPGPQPSERHADPSHST